MTIRRYQSDMLKQAGFGFHGFTQTTGGVSRGPFESLNLAYGVGDRDEDVATNLKRFQADLDTSMPLARVKQVHGYRVVSASDVASTDWTRPSDVEADGVAATGNGVAAVQTADCAAVLLADPESRVVAAVHAGWRGAASGVIRHAARKMGELGASPARLIAAIGPHICQSCFEVGADVADRLPESADPVKGQPGKFTLDLANAIEVSLIIAGVASSRIDRVPVCTRCQDAPLFSYRGSGGTCGRMLGYISPVAS